jgi:hypothetical protein
VGAPVLAVIHYNARLAHQVAHAAAFLEGFKRHGITAQATPERDTEGDLHIVSGPWYALDRWAAHPRTILIDRAYWGDPDCVSIGWLLPDGGRYYAAAMPPDRWRASGQELRPLREGGESLLLGDYPEDRRAYRRQMALHGIRRFRPHPSAAAWPDCPAEILTGDLAAILTDYGTAYGYKSTALVLAALHGLNIVALDPRAITARWAREHREAWCYDLAYAQWSLAEIAAGHAWEHLRQCARSSLPPPLKSPSHSPRPPNTSASTRKSAPTSN